MSWMIRLVWVATMIAGPAMAGTEYETLEVPSYFRVEPERSVPMGFPRGWVYVRQLIIDARAYGRAGTVEIIANGRRKWAATIPTEESRYTVTINDNVGSVTVRNLGGGSVGILKASVFCATRPLFDIPEKHPVRWIGNRCVTLVDQLEPFADEVREYSPCLLPIKIKAGKVRVAAKAYGEASFQARAALTALWTELDMNHTCLENLASRRDSYYLARELASYREEIEKRLR